MADGKVLVAGLSSSFALTSAELYDPSRGSWTETASMIETRSSYTATLLPDGTVLVAGGAGGGLRWRASAELFDPRGGT